MFVIVVGDLPAHGDVDAAAASSRAAPHSADSTRAVLAHGSRRRAPAELTTDPARQSCGRRCPAGAQTSSSRMSTVGPPGYVGKAPTPRVGRAV